MLQRVLNAISNHQTKAKLGVRFVSDQDPACTGELLLYTNYASAREAVCARDRSLNMSPHATTYLHFVAHAGFAVRLPQVLCVPKYVVLVYETLSY